MQKGRPPGFPWQLSGAASASDQSSFSAPFPLHAAPEHRHAYKSYPNLVIGTLTLNQFTPQEQAPIV